MDSGKISFDFDAMRKAFEGSVVRGLLSSTGIVADDHTRKIIFGTLDVFARHGIGAVEAMQIIVELGNMPQQE